MQETTESQSPITTLLTPQSGSRRWVVVATLLLFFFAGLGAFATSLRVDNRIEAWLVQTPEEIDQYECFRAHFGSDEYEMVMYEGAPLFSPEGLEYQIRALEQLEAVDGVAWVMSLPGVYRDVFGAENPEAFEADTLATPFYKGCLLSEDAHAAAMLVSFKPDHGAVKRQQLVRDIANAAEPLRAAGYHVHVAGPPLLNVALDETSRRAAIRSFPISVALSLLVLAFLFRSIWATVVAAASAGLATAATLGLVALLGYPITMASSALPALVWALSLSGVTHIIRRFQIQHDAMSDRETAMSRALAQLAGPVAIAAISDAAGFLSLTTVAMGPVREVGLFAGIGMLFSLAINLYLAPVALLWGPPVQGVAPQVRRWTRIISRLVSEHPRSIVAFAGLLFLGFCATLPYLRVESDPLTYLPNDSETVRDYTAVQESGLGFYTLELVITPPVPWTSPLAWSELERVQTILTSQPGVVRVLSPLDVLKKLRQSEEDAATSYAVPPDDVEARRLLELLPASQRGLLSHLSTSDGRTLRMSVLIGGMNSSEFKRIVDVARAELGAMPQGWQAYPTGIVLQLVESQLALVRTQLHSFGLAFVLIFGVILIGLRSVKRTLLAVPSNLFPVLSAFAFMALTRMALDVATVMMAGVTLGIAVDDTIHFMEVFRMRRRGHGESRPLAIAATLETVGPASAMTLITAVVGFLSLTVSDFTPLVWFGIVSAGALMVALAADLFLTPAILMLAGDDSD